MPKQTNRRRVVQRKARLLIALALVLTIFAGIGGSGLLAYRSVKDQTAQLEAQLIGHLQLGQRELEAAKTSLHQANLTHDEKLIGQAKVHFIAAKLQFLTTSQIADNSDLLRRIEGFPSVGRLAKDRHVAVDGIAQMGVELSSAGEDLTDLDGQLIKPGAGHQQGRDLLLVVNEVEGKVVTVRTELEGALKAADQVDVAVLPTGEQATFSRAKGTIAQALAALEQFQALVPILTEVMGGNGARTYLVEQVNPAELRPGGGFIGTYSVLRADHGSLSLIKSGDAADLIYPRASVGQPGYIAPPGPFEQLIPGTSWSFIDTNFFADFPSNAQAGERLAESHLGFHIDAVVAIDYNTVAGLLTVTGPMSVPGYGITLTGDNFVSTVVQYDARSLTDPTAPAIHKAILAAVAGPLLERIVTLQPSQWPALLSTLNNLAASRDLQFYFNNGDVEDVMTQYGWSGVDKATSSRDYLMEVEANMGGTKANYYMTRSYTVELTRVNNALHHKLTVAVTDNMPYLYVPNEFYHAYIRLYTSAAMTDYQNSLAHPHYPNLPRPPGTKQLDGWVTVHGYGHTIVMQFEWDTPWIGNSRGSEQVYWQKQPGTNADAIQVVWHDGNGHTYKVNGDLGQDRIITLAPNGVSLTQGQVGTAQLPSLSLG